MLSHDLWMVVAAWGLLAPVLIGLGLLVRRLLGAPAQTAGDLWLAFWLGWTRTLLLLQLVQFAWPIADRARMLVGVVAIAGLVLGGWRPWFDLLRRLPRHAIPLAAFAVATLWLANHALYGPRFGDSGMYFIPKIVWLETFRIVPGLANLFVPLGHNQTFLLYSALLDSAPFVGRSYHITNSVLVWALVGRGLLGCEHLLRRGTTSTAADLFYALMLPALSNQALSVFFTSPSPDLCICLFGIVLSGELIAFVERRRRGCDSRFALRTLAWIAGAAITVKLSIGGLSAALLPVALLCWWVCERPKLGDVVAMGAQMALITAVAVVPWMASNLITSGCPLYPSKWGALPVDWTTKLDAVGWIQGPMQIDILDLWRSPRWFQGRLLSLGWGEHEVLDSLMVGAAALLLGIPLRLWRWWRGVPSRLPAAILLPTLVSFVFCFLNAPMPRYQGATIWIFAVQLLLLGVGESLLRAGWWQRAALLASVAAATALPFFRGAEPWSPVKEFEFVGRTPVEEVRLASGLVVTVPKGTPTCWDASLPCTPEPHPGLQLRRDDDLASGFTIDLALGNAKAGG